MNPLEPPLEILLEDGPVIAVNKPPGLLTQGVPHGIPTLEAQVKEYLKAKYSKPGNVYLGVPHRLDRPVSGVVLFARNSKAAARLAEQFRERQVRKIYWAVVERPPDPPEGTLTDWLLKIPDEARAEIVPPGTPSARECSLGYRTLASDGALTLVEIELGTGRMHQIRVQFASRGWHLLGDFQYGATAALCSPLPLGEGPGVRVMGTRLIVESASSAAADSRSEPIALHARSLTFLHPIRYDTVTLTAPLPCEWCDATSLLRNAPG